MNHTHDIYKAMNDAGIKGAFKLATMVMLLNHSGVPLNHAWNAVIGDIAKFPNVTAK